MSSPRSATRRHATYVFLIITISFCTFAFANSSTARDKVVWGAVGHDDRPGRLDYSYSRVPLEKQMHLLTQAGLRAYRVGCVSETCDALIALAQKEKLLLLRSFGMQPDATLSEEENYQRGYAFALTEARKYKGAFRYYEASNEVENWVGVRGDGSVRAHYNPARYSLARGLIRGLIDGVHAGNPAAQVMVDDSGWCHYGFMRALWEDGVRWDITAFHWYSHYGSVESVISHQTACNGANVVAIHASFGRPIWITEFNLKAEPGRDSPEEAARYVTDFMAQINGIAARYNIRAAFVYELLDEPSASGGERFYGIVNADGTPKASWNAIRHQLIGGRG